MNVVKMASEFADNMRNAGTLTAQATSNTIELLAQAEKLGVLGTGSLIENATRPDDYPIMDSKDVKYLY